MKKVVSILLVAVLVFSFAACSGGTSGGSSGVEGKWKLDSMNMGGVSVTADGSADLGVDFSGFELEFKSGGKFSMSMEGESADGTYTNDGNAYTLTSDGESISGTLSDDGKEFTIEEEGVSLVFVKA
ncbi:MAG: hypothetical protein ACK5LX_11470 [Oscillospiraceae bacterium]